jgi:hypothetical protein
MSFGITDLVNDGVAVNANGTSKPYVLGFNQVSRPAFYAHELSNGRRHSTARLLLLYRKICTHLRRDEAILI